MPPVAKRRKTIATAAGTCPAPALQSRISTFGKITKSHTEQHRLSKRKQKIGEVTEPEACGEDKRTSEVADQPEGEAEESVKKPKKQSARQQILNGKVDHEGSREDAYAERVVAANPKTPRKRNLFQFIDTQTPTKGARSYLESLALSSSPASKRTSSPQATSRCVTPLSSPPPASRSPSPIGHHSADLPEELSELVDLHSSFLTALSLHYAHHGTLTPVDIRVLRPSVERVWGKRRISTKDIRRILAIQNRSRSAKRASALEKSSRRLYLTDYGHNRTCIEISEPTNDYNPAKRLINEEYLNTQFVFSLKRQWTTYNSLHTDSSVSGFISSISLAPITLCVSAEKLSCLLARGQRRLEDLKAGAVKSQRPSNAQREQQTFSDTENFPPIQKQPVATLSRSNSLRDRIKAKQMKQANLPPPPSQAELERKVSLQRIEELLPVLELLTTSGSSKSSVLGEKKQVQNVQSFTMATIVQHLQMSLRNPISKEDAIRCVRLIAEEVAPEWVGVKEVGKLVGVTLRKNGMLGRDLLVGRVHDLLGKICITQI
ncbi:MAG: hypothetical protein LQ351_007495 [Letrouitia transgressa]|nr:MAG: hypothetical protein LQ351_007495 [Letrouitia transgressa]